MEREGVLSVGTGGAVEVGDKVPNEIPSPPLFMGGSFI